MTEDNDTRCPDCSADQFCDNCLDVISSKYGD